MRLAHNPYGLCAFFCLLHGLTRINTRPMDILYTLLMKDDIENKLHKRLGRVHARQRLGIESDKERHIFGGGLNFFHPENWYSLAAILRYTLKLTGLYYLGQRNTRRLRVVHNSLCLPGLPGAFEGYTILHLSDLHVDMNQQAMRHMTSMISEMDYDLCVLTGDYRARTFGAIDATIAGMSQVAHVIDKPAFAVLGNHDSILMVPELEDMGFRLLLNESVVLERGEEQIYLAGVDDAHYFRVDNIQKARSNIPEDAPSLLLSHTPEIYQQAAHADFNAYLCGHTHGGQICIPGGYPITLDAKCPRYMGSGSWQYHTMHGYTSVGAGSSIVNVRFNCPPEITLHRLTAGTKSQQGSSAQRR